MHVLANEFDFSDQEFTALLTYFFHSLIYPATFEPFEYYFHFKIKSLNVCLLTVYILVFDIFCFRVLANLIHNFTESLRSTELELLLEEENQNKLEVS